MRDKNDDEKREKKESKKMGEDELETYLRKRLCLHSEVGKRCFYCSLMDVVVICVWRRRIYLALRSSPNVCPVKN